MMPPPSTMILRNAAIRHGRRALAVCLRRPLIRSLTTEIRSPSDDGAQFESTRVNHAVEGHSGGPAVHWLHLAQKIARPTEQKQRDEAVKRDHQLKKHIVKRTGKLGSMIEPYYRPDQVLINPPSPQNVTLELLMASQSHLGHNTSLWNPMNQRYIYGVRQGIHIISLEVIATALRRAAKVVEGVAYHGGLILFVGTREGQRACVVTAAQMAKGCHLFQRWTPGSITNGDQILGKCGISAVDAFDKPIDGFEDKLLDWTALKPDLVVCLNPLENYVLLHECGLNNIPTIGVIDTDADPTWVTYPIPANDDSLRCIQVIAGVLGRAGQNGQKKRLEAAETGEVTWLPPPNLGEPESAEAAAKKKEVEKEMGVTSISVADYVQQKSKPEATDEEIIDDL